MEPSPQTNRGVTLNIRAKVRQRSLIDQAASRLGRSRSEFMLEAACQKAEDVLLDQTFFRLSAEGYRAFCELLDNPPEPNERLRHLLQTKGPWDK